MFCVVNTFLLLVYILLGSPEHAMDHPEICAVADEMISHCSSVITWKCAELQQGSPVADGRKTGNLFTLAGHPSPRQEQAAAGNFKWCTGTHQVFKSHSAQKIKYLYQLAKPVSIETLDTGGRKKTSELLHNQDKYP